MAASISRPPVRARPAVAASAPPVAAAVPAVRLSVLMARQSGLFTRAQATACGFTAHQIRRRLRSGEWQALFGPVLAGSGLRLTTELRDVAALLAVDGSVLAGPSAARRLGIPIAEPRSYLLVPTRTRARLPGVRLLRDTAPSDDLGLVDGLPVTAKARTVFDCLRILPDAAAGELLDLALGAGWISVDELAVRLHRFAGRRGAKRLTRICRPQPQRRPTGGSPSGGRAAGARLPASPRVVLFETAAAAVELRPKAGTPARRAPASPPAAARFTRADLLERPGVVLATLRAALDACGE